MLQEYLLEIGFEPSFAELSISMRKCPTADHYEYIATYVDKLALIMIYPKTFIAQLESAPYNFKLRGSRPLKFPSRM